MKYKRTRDISCVCYECIYFAGFIAAVVFHVFYLGN